MTEYEKQRHRLYRELFENLPPNLMEELSRQMEEIRSRRSNQDNNSILTESIIEQMIRSNIVNRAVNELLPPPANTDWLAHNRVAKVLTSNGVKILNVGNKGYPDLLFESQGEVFAAEVKGEADRLQPHQEVVIDALRRLKRVFVVRESGKKQRPDEVTLDEFLGQISQR